MTVIDNQEFLEELEEILEQIDIVDYISQFVELDEKHGEYWGLSPFSNERTPSFSVRREDKNFYCFSSGIGGNAYTFTKKYHNCGKDEAMRILRGYLGCEDSVRIPKIRLEATTSCRKFKRPEHKRKVSTNFKTYPNNYMEKYENREDMLAIWESEGISKESLQKFEVRYDSISNRLVYPIRNLNGVIVNIGGRTLDPEWKEKKLRKYMYFSGWGEMDVLYGLYENLDAILAKREVIIFEGCKSVLLADSWGIHNTCALLTSHCNPQQMKILARLGVRVVFALDKEVRVRKDYNITRLKNYVDVEYLWDRADLTDDKDAPVDKGKEVFLRLYEQRLRYR